jgi:hypothetical protein
LIPLGICQRKRPWQSGHKGKAGELKSFKSLKPKQKPVSPLSNVKAKVASRKGLRSSLKGYNPLRLALLCKQDSSEKIFTESANLTRTTLLKRSFNAHHI